MQHTLIAVFDNRTDAQAAKTELYAAGFSGAEIRQNDTGAGTGNTTAANSAGSTDATADQDGSFTAGIKHFFSDLFGSSDADQSTRYADAVTRGQHVLTLVTMSETEVERAADIVERHGPVDIDEEAGGQSVSGGQSLTGGAMGALGQQGQQQYAGMSQQSGSAGTQTGSANVQGGIVQDMSDQGGAQSGMGAGAMGGGSTGSQQRAEGTVLPVIEEELRVGKREVQRGGVRIFQRVVETPVNESVTLREEHVSVERRPVDQPVNPADMANFQEKSIELRETAEEAVVEKAARVVEEVVVGKQVTQREEQIADTVRHTEVDVEQLGKTGSAGMSGMSDTAGMSGAMGAGGSGMSSGLQSDAGSAATGMLGQDDDSYFRKHYDANYGASGRPYQDYTPAYSYGSTMAANEQYRGKAWNDVEPNLRQDWESRNPGSAWDNFKAAVRHGWEKITG
ncbi:MAG: YsnF/AvaK domain-containing protein [Massilia sp.]